MSTHLWEGAHPYYAEAGNFYSNDCHGRFDSWEQFKTDGIYNADRDQNLVYRWDWRKNNNPGDVLEIYVMGQRKALGFSQYIEVTEADEPEVRAWLVECAQTITAIWAPINLEEGWVS